MKILILANIDMGLYKFRKELIEELVRNNKVYFCTPDGEFVSRIQEMGCKFIPCKEMDRRGTNPIKDIKLIRFYNYIIHKLKPDIVLTYTIKPNVYGGIACIKNKTPYISNITGLGTTIENGGFLAKISLLLYKIGLRNASCVFFQNQENQKFFLKKRIVTNKTRLIPGSGVNLDTHCLEPYPSDENEIHFLFVGRIMKDKGIEELLKAIHKLHLKYKNVFLDVVGFCDEDYTDLLETFEKKGEIINHGIQDDVHPFYTLCHCTVLPSYHEGMANVLLESSSTGRPVISTRVPGCQETFEEEKTGFGCEAKDVKSLYEAMERFLLLSNSQREEMGLKAREKMEAEYDRKSIINAYKEEIAILLNDFSIKN